MKQYLLSVMHDGDYPTPEPEVLQQMFKQVSEFNEKITASGNWVFGGGLLPKDLATTVRYRDGDVLVTDGPFAECKEQMGGFWVIQAEDLDEALTIAREGAAACMGEVEVRPFQDGG